MVFAFGKDVGEGHAVTQDYVGAVFVFYGQSEIAVIEADDFEEQSVLMVGFVDGMVLRVECELVARDLVDDFAKGFSGSVDVDAGRVDDELDRVACLNLMGVVEVFSLAYGVGD